MVIVLADHLYLHVFTVFGESIRFSYGVNNRYLYRSQYTQLIAHFQHNGTLRIMGYTQKIGSHIFQQFYILNMVTIRQSITQAFKILVPAGSHEFKRLSIQKKTFISIKFKPS